MKNLSTKRLLIAVFGVAVIGAALFGFLALQNYRNVSAPKPAPEQPAPAPAAKKPEVKWPVISVLGSSVQGRPIESYTFGKGPERLVFVGGIHGGYEWNSVVLAYQFIDYLNQNPQFIPANVAITVIPSMNPDGVFKVIGKEGYFSVADVPAGSKTAGRLNANKVDLNRNFDCNWKPTGVWQEKPVSAGSAAFSEPESAAIRNFVLETRPDAVVFWHSQANAVYGSQCGGDMLHDTLSLMTAYADASGYPAKTTFDDYEVSGDATDWMASIGIVAFSVELKTHETVDWDQNLAGISTLVNYFARKEQ